MFVAIVTYNSGHGLVSRPFIISEYLPKIIEEVQLVEGDRHLHYEFYEDETGFVVYDIPMNKALSKLNFDGDIGNRLSPSYPIIFSKVRMKGKWEERWWNRDKVKRLVPRSLPRE
ncbi:MAG: hypothetical protein WCW78_02095 [Candidatus Paceibacterota bacterium]|jgi:hypothetical protein